MGSGIAGIFGGNDAAEQNRKAQAFQKEMYNAAIKTLNKGESQAQGYIQPYAGVGQNALNELAYGMGLDVPKQKFTSAQAPNKLTPIGDPVWDKIISDVQARHQAKYGKKIDPNRTDEGVMNELEQAQIQYANAKNAEDQAQPAYQGNIAKGSLLNYGQNQYQKDVGYTPMVKSLADLQATPGYQFQLEQGLQGVNNSAAARGKLLSGANLKAINDYAQGQASTGYQNAWERAQSAYQNAFNRNQQKFGNLQSMANNGQNAAGQQAGYAQNLGTNTANLNMGNASSMNNLYNQMGQIQMQQAQNYGNLGNQAILGVVGGNNISNVANKGLFNL